MAYSVVSQNNTVTKLEDDQGNVIHVPAIASLAKSSDYTIIGVKNSKATLEDGNGKVHRNVPCVVLLADDSSNYTKISQNNTKATLENTDGNVINVPSKVILATATDYTLVKVNNSTATLEDASGNIIRDVPCVSMLSDESNTISTLNNSTASLLDGNGKTINDVPCIVVLLKASGGAVVVIIKGTSPLNLPDAIADSLSYVKAFGGTEQRNLPDNYIERQFIYMMDGSYLLTDIVPTYDCKIEIDFETTGLTPGGTASFLGGRSNTNVGCGLSLRYANSIFAVDAFGLNSNDTYTSSVAPTANTRYKFTYDNQVATLESGGSTLFTNTMTGTQANGAALAINAMNSNGTTVIPGAGIYLYSFKVWNAQGELVADYVPAVQKGTVPVVGFYDTVSKTFKTATAGTFAAGGEAVPTPDAPIDIVSNNGVLKARHQSGLPLGYTLLEYIETASGSYIDTGITPTINAKADVKFAPTQTSTAGYWGARSDPNRFCCTTFSSGTQFGIGMTNNTWPANRTPITLGSIYDCVVANGYASVNGTEYTETPVESFGNANTFCLGKVAAAGSTNYSAAKYYECKLWENNVLVFDGIPAKNASDVIGMYDLVSGQFFTNAGTDTFTAGDPVSDPVEIYTDGTVETINVHGKNLFDSANNKAFVSEGQTVTISFTNPGSRTTVATDTGVVVMTRSSGQIGYQSETAVIPAGASYLTVAQGYGSASEVQIEQGSTATTYAPYYDGGTATAEMLLKVGDYQDVQSIIDGVVTRNVRVLVLDGTEPWTSSQAYSNVYTASIAVGKPSGGMAPICNYYAGYSSYISMTANDYGILMASTATLAIKNKDCANVTAFKTWLADQYAAGHPVIVLYPLATATTESVTGQTLQVTAGDNVLEITQASLDGLELEAEYQAAVSLTIQEVQDANLDPNVQVTIN